MIQIECTARVDPWGVGQPTQSCPFKIISDDVMEAVDIHARHVMSKHTLSRPGHVHDVNGCIGGCSVDRPKSSETPAG